MATTKDLTTHDYNIVITKQCDDNVEYTLTLTDTGRIILQYKTNKGVLTEFNDFHEQVSIAFYDKVYFVCSNDKRFVINEDCYNDLMYLLSAAGEYITCSAIRIGFKYSCIGDQLTSQQDLLSLAFDVQQSVVKGSMKSKKPRNKIAGTINANSMRNAEDLPTKDLSQYDKRPISKKGK